MTTEDGLREIDFSGVGKISRSVNLLSVELFSFSFDTFLPPDALNPGSHLDYDFSMKGVLWSFIPEARRSRVFVSYALTSLCRTDGSADEKQLFNINAVWRVSYDILAELEDVSEEVKGDFAYTSGQLHSFPFMRQHVFDVTGRAGWPGLMLPLFNVPSTRHVDAAASLQTRAKKLRKKPAKP